MAGGDERSFRRSAEDRAGGRVIEALRNDGRTVLDVTRPDRGMHDGRAPDFAFRLDDRRTALEVTEFTISEQRTRGQAVIGRLVHRLRTELTPIVQERHLGLVRLSMHFESPLVPPVRQIGRAFQPVEDAIRALLLSAPPTTEPYTVEVEVPLPWSPFRPRLSFAPASRGLGAFDWMTAGNAWYSASAAMVRGEDDRPDGARGTS